jgi:riboflavin kinase/FMN adenylyltransferase
LKVVITNLIDLKPFERDTALCLGFFDGVHRGHRALIETAKASGLDLAVLTFDRSPKAAIGSALLSTVEDRLAIFKSMGVTTTLLVIFDETVKSLSAEKFIETLNRLNVKKVFCGPDFRFGHKAMGDSKMLKYGLGRHFITTIVDEVEEDHAKISSSRIVKHLQYGNINAANKMLGRPYSIKGSVVKGKGNGRKLGYPTANLSLSANYVLPLNGVYATAITIQGQRFYSMASVGYHPTIAPVEKPLVEVHIFDFKKNIYKQDVNVEFLQFMRPEITFATIGELVVKMREDEREILALKNGLIK